MDSKSLLNFFAAQNAEIDILWFVIHFLLAALLSYLLAKAYLHFGNALSNHEIPTKHFPIGERVAKMEISLGQQVAQKSCQEEVNHKPKDVNLGILGGKKIQ